MADRDGPRSRRRLTVSRGEALSLGLAVLALSAAVAAILAGLGLLAFVVYAIATFP
ncbi:hypothetical protein AERO_16540 [Aeromicrobium fastidiosum]|uniref:hypothetical protein n=1 Tax=Aeromicrobium fastidiosum TaxID=52699 RepID=UPI0020233830|nr:hypothetical protein [Aeromicrobium fastidiosum]MCL8252999.1 hypothetical protein [Aeromicrobium fastidiosum]